MLSEINSDTVDMKYVSRDGTVVKPLKKSVNYKKTEFSDTRDSSGYSKSTGGNDFQQKQEFNAMVFN